MTWQAGDETTLRGYKYTYDGLDRLKAATYGEGSALSTNSGRFTESVGTYDKNGNIQAGYVRSGVTSTGGYGNVQALTITLNGNQLQAVTDHVPTTGEAEFKDGATETVEYTYDDNGNLTKDSNKGITNITYNCLNLPSVVTFSSGNTITYTYTADGTKLRTAHKIGTTTTTTDYCGNVIYESGVQKRLLTEEGYVDLSVTTPVYYYYLKDHQGNNRVVINSSGTVQETNHYYPFGGTFTASSVQPYKYNGKELDTKAGLNWYDYGARHYDAVLGRWHTMDPLAEKMYSWSPYAYCFNNPTKFVDKDGKFPGPGDLFSTTRSAAKDWGWYYNGASIVYKREMGSSIYEVKNGNKVIGYSYTPATVGDAHKTGFSKPKIGNKVVATIHSHGNYDGKITQKDGSVILVEDNKFSEADKSYNNQSEKIGYLTTPNGSLLEHNPYTDKVTVIADNLPSDMQDPNRKNKTSATKNPQNVPLMERFIDWFVKSFINKK